MKARLFAIWTLVITACGLPPLADAEGSMDPIDLPVVMVAIGDFGDGGPDQYSVASQVRKRASERGASVLVTTGDNFYSDAVRQIWEQPYGWIADDGIALAPAWGNHDLDSERRQRLVEEVLAPPGRWYSADLGSGKLIILDSTRVDDRNQRAWLVEQLDDADEPLIISFHHPAFSCGHHGSTESVLDGWAPLFDDHDVTLVLNGHDHHYERFEVDSTTYVVTGGGGRHLRDKKECPDGTPEPLAADYDTHHFVLMEVSETSISAEVVGADGEVLDRFVVDY